MIINVKVITRAKKTEVKQEGDLFKVYVKAPPVEGKANKEVIEVLSEHFGVKKTSIEIIRGKTSRNKTVKIL